ncbi:radical SAM protein [Nocardia sp. NPDC004068]|uniref:radical SAM protein n=1 Tax=Nocardia sp. NPDC004068 TaxID=3364303 RepID=UPI0036BDA275
MIVQDTLDNGLFLEDIQRLADKYGVFVEDALLIALNLYGISSDEPRHRARLTVRLTSRKDVPWMVIIPLNAVGSPFKLRDNELYLGSDLVGTVHRIDADEAVGGYFRNNGRAVTLNPNARSRCTGCAFCPNTLEAAADPRLSEERQLSELLYALREQHPRGDLSEIQEITVSTGCFEHEAAALSHLRSLRRTLTDHGIGARIGLLTSVIRSDAAISELATTIAPFVLRLTIECFSRRELLLKASKAELRPSDMADLLHRAQDGGIDTSFTYICGLDHIVELRMGLAPLAPYITEFPNFQVYQAHNAIMAGLRAPGASEVEYFLRARKEIEEIFGPTGLRPQAWEGYRPLWYFTFGDEKLVA